MRWLIPYSLFLKFVKLSHFLHGIFNLLQKSLSHGEIFGSVSSEFSRLLDLPEEDDVELHLAPKYKRQPSSTLLLKPELDILHSMLACKQAVRLELVLRIVYSYSSLRPLFSGALRSRATNILFSFRIRSTLIISIPVIIGLRVAIEVGVALELSSVAQRRRLPLL